MRNTYFVFVGSLVLAVTGLFAQGPKGRGPGAGMGSGQPSVDMSTQVPVQGKVTAVNIGFGAQYPSIKVDTQQALIKIAPVWFLLEKDFELENGQEVSLLAVHSTRPDDQYLYAVRIDNKTTGKSVVLRDEAGIPLWTGRRGPSGDSERAGLGIGAGGCVEPSSIQRDVPVTVVEVTMGLGIRQPMLVVKTVDGSQISLKIGPERILLANEFELKAGDALKVTYGKTACTGELVVLSLTTGDKTLILRNDDGSVAW